MSTIPVTAHLSTLFCYHGGDEDGDSEPYLWTIMFAIDGSTITQNVNALVGTPRFFFGPGSQGNLGSSVSTGSTLHIPDGIGLWKTTLQPLLITNPVTKSTIEVPGVLGVIGVLMEENDTPDEDMEVGHQAINQLVIDQLQQWVTGIDLLVVATLVQEAMAKGKTEVAATKQVFQDLLKPVENNFKAFSEAVVVDAVVKSLGLGGGILAGISADKYQGKFYHSWDQTVLEATAQNGGPGKAALPPIAFTDYLAQPGPGPDWAYNLHGAVWQAVNVTDTPIPEGVPPGRWQVTGVNKALSHERGIWIRQIGGTLPGGSPWYLERGSAVDLIQQGKHSFYVAGASTQAEVVVSEALKVGHPYLTTTPDGDKTDNLLSLPPCAVSIRHVTNAI